MKSTQMTTAILLLSAAFIAQPLHAQNATGYAGYFSSPDGIGVYGYTSGDRSAPNTRAPGVSGESKYGVGVYGRGDASNSYSFYNEGGYFEGGKGLYARGMDPANQDGYGARIYSDNYRGMYVAGSSGYFDAYFGGNSGINTSSVVTRLTVTQSLVVNLGESPIEPGDLVAMVGITPSVEDGQPMLGVAKLDAGNQNAVIGVAKQAILNKIVTMEGGNEYVDFQPTSGSIAPENYLVIVTAGLAPAVNLNSLAFLSEGKVGDKIAIATQIDGEIAFALNSDAGRSSYQANAIVIGKMAGAIDETNGTIPMFIDID